MSSVITLRLKRRRAFSNDSPSCSRTSAIFITPKPTMTYFKLTPFVRRSVEPTAKSAICFARVADKLVESPTTISPVKCHPPSRNPHFCAEIEFLPERTDKLQIFVTAARRHV
jgi:hypothetical protein